MVRSVGHFPGGVQVGMFRLRLSFAFAKLNPRST